jgi:hypothetical protein
MARHLPNISCIIVCWVKMTTTSTLPETYRTCKYKPIQSEFSALHPPLSLLLLMPSIFPADPPREGLLPSSTNSLLFVIPHFLHFGLSFRSEAEESAVCLSFCPCRFRVLCLPVASFAFVFALHFKRISASRLCPTKNRLIPSTYAAPAQQSTPTPL